MPFRSILVPLDGSREGEQALPVANMIAAQQGAAVHLVHVHTPNDIISIEGMPVLDEQMHSLGREHEHVYLDRIAQPLRAEASLDVTTAVLDHPVAPVLLRYANENDIELLVLTSHGHGGFVPAWLGSVADTLVRNSHFRCCWCDPRTVWHNRYQWSACWCRLTAARRANRCCRLRLR